MNGREQAGIMPDRPRALSANARALYLATIEGNGKAARREDSPQEAASFDELVTLGLLVPDMDEPGLYAAVDPAQLSNRMSLTWQRQALDLLTRAVALPADLGDLAEAFHSRGQEGGPIEYVRGKALINQRILQAQADGPDEALAMQPGGPRPPEVLAAGLDYDFARLKMGASMRTIYHASTRYHQPTRDYVATLSAAGWQFRTLDEPYTRLIIIDRRLAVIPAADDMDLAAFIHDQYVIEYLVEEVFERNWSRALEFDGATTVPQQVVSRLRQTIIDLLLAGTNHRVIARRLGISERTLARHLAEMREDYNVESLFQLGYVLGRATPGHDEQPEATES
ncbi:helix-turn-helix domain-containing protein [Streptomyces kaniharaensis]|uniref:Helix-turn-helix domain-containing protein n=1 Tax=Streptomyces kaniharaensis TaxID=212423 RepID=A0A6N7KUJ9_9ACTN|nr:helix-turn-helix domain-containing protein [Streptomyces kaniharaensis]MQS13273.1 helix-turn-helix domain-containing protein [Streptomyces kaniharaensis]